MNIDKTKLKELLEETTNELERHCINDLLEQEDCYLTDILNGGCSGGSCNNLIYYVDTKAFYIKYMEEIDELKEEMEQNLGEPLKIGYPSYNWLAWFGYEETMRKVAEKLGMEI